VALALILLSAARCPASDVSMGPLCLGGIPLKVDKNQGHWDYGPDMTWKPVTSSVKPPPPRRPVSTILLLEKPVTDPNPTPDCSRALALAETQGIKVLLRGRLTALELKGKIGTGRQGNGFEITPYKGGSLRATIGRVDAGLSPVGGGQLSLAGRRAYVTNHNDQILALPGKATGTFHIEVNDPAFKAAHIQLPGGAEAITDLRMVKPVEDNLHVLVDIATGLTTLWKGTLASTTRPLTFVPGALELPFVKVGGASVKLDRLVVVAANGRLTATLQKGEGTAGTATFASDHVQLRAGSTTLGWSRATATATHDVSAIRIGDLALSGFSAASSRGGLESGDITVLSGSLRGTFPVLSAQDVQGSLLWTSPAIGGLPLAIPPDGAISVEVRLSGPPGNVAVAGSVSVKSFGFGNLELDSPTVLSFSNASIGREIAVPIAIDIPEAKGEFRVRNADRNIVLRGGLDRLRLKAQLNISLRDPGSSKLDIGAEGFEVSLHGSICDEPFLAGQRPSLASVGVVLHNPVPLVWSQKTRAGHVALESDVLVVVSPTLKLGEGASPVRSSLNLKASTKVVFHYDLEKSKMVLVKARLNADGTDFRTIDPGGTADLGGTIITDPHFHLDSLSVDIDRFSPSPDKPTRVATASGLKIEGTHYERSRSAPTETAWGGSATTPFQIQEIVGEPEFTETSFEVRNITAKGVRLGLADAHVTLGREVVLDQANISVEADSIRSVYEADVNDDDSPKKNADGTPAMAQHEYLANLHIAAKGRMKESEFSPRMQLDVPPTVYDLTLTANGRSSKLDGDGSFKIGAFSGRLESPLKFSFECENGSNPETTLVHRVSTGGSAGALAIRIEHGKFSVAGPLALLNDAFLSNTATECTSKSQEKIISEEKKVSMTGWCPTWDNPGRTCEWSTIVPKVAVEYYGKFFFYALTGQVTVAAPLLISRDNSTKFCYVPPVVAGPMLVSMGVTPQIKFSNTIPQPVSDFVNGAIHVTAAATESALGTTLANALGSVSSAVANTPLGAAAACILAK